MRRKSPTFEHPLLVMLPLFRLVKNFFGFSRAQTNGLFILLPLLMLLLFSAPAYRWWRASQPMDVREDQRKLDSLVALMEVQMNHTASPRPVSLHDFNPNLATAEELQSLGLDTIVALRFVHFRERGGRFKMKTDVLKIFGMDTAWFRTISPYIQLPENAKPSISFTKKPMEKFPARAPLKKFDLNLADTAQLKKVYGIGEKLSLRIIKYRDVLGGFVSSAQLHEVWGLDSAAIDRLKQVSFIETNFRPRMLSINKAREEEIAIHPYLSKSAAKAITAYRFQHGRFQSIADLEKVQSLDLKTIHKIEPYLEFQD